MKVTLAGPDDLGYWFLEDDEGNAFDLVTTEEEHISAAALFGYKGQDADEAREWLMDHIGGEIDAPPDVAKFFKELYEDQKSE